MAGGALDRRTLIGVVCGLALAVLLGAGGIAVGVGIGASGSAWTRWAEVLDPPVRVVPDAHVLVRDVRALARLETASVTLEQRVVGQRGTDGSWGYVGERLEFVARGHAVAGIDLARLADGDLTVDEAGVVTVRLPAAELLSVHLDEEGSRVANRERGWFAWTDPQLETRVRQEAVRSLREEAGRTDLLERAERGAEEVVGGLLRSGGASEVRFLGMGE